MCISKRRYPRGVTGGVAERGGQNVTPLNFFLDKEHLIYIIGVMNLKVLSLHRKKVSLLIQRRRRLERIAMGRAPMVAASFMARRLKPGGPLTYDLSASIKGESRHRYVRKTEMDYWHKRASAWKEFLKAMASWVKVNREIEKELREIGRLRCDPLPGGGKGGRRTDPLQGEQG
jgi:hypothetical protein